MNPVLEEVIQKDGSTKVVFSATPRMLLYAITWAQDLTRIENEVCDKIGIHRRSIKRWKELYDTPKQARNYFSNWLEETVEALANTDEQKKAVLEAVGMIEATQGKYQFWRDMSRTYGAIKEETKATSITINTDFSQIAIGANFDEARRKILRDATGVELPRGTPVAPTLEPRQEHKGDGDGASGLQSITLEVPNPLDSNGKRSKRGGTISILSPKIPPRTDH